jgi:hypothetical protein
MSNRVVVTLDLPPLQAQALAQLVKRIGWTELRQNAQDDEEAYDMRNAVQELQNALALAGYAPR